MHCLRFLHCCSAGLALPVLLHASIIAVQAEEAPVKPEIRRLLPVDFWDADPDLRIRIGGSAVGGGGTPSAFYSAAVEALDKGLPAEVCMEMSRHSNLCVRVVGMAGLAQAGSPEGIARLKELLASREGETGMPGGCIPAKLYESAIAWHFLTDTGFLCSRRKTPLLPDEEVLALALEVLYRDDCAGARETDSRWWQTSAPARRVAQEITSGRLVLSMERLHTAAPSLKPHQLVKAAGRLPAELNLMFLIGIVHDTAAAPESRLAAASALAWRLVLLPGQEHFESAALLAVRDDLNRLAPGMWGGAFGRLEAHSYSLNIYNPPTRWPLTNPLKKGYCPGEFIVPQTAWALTPVHFREKPLAVDSWNDVAACVSDNINNYTLWSAGWNAFGDTLYRLELFARHVGQYGERDVEPESDRLALLKAIAEVLRASR